MITGFASVCLCIVYVGREINAGLSLVYKQIDSQPKRIADEIKLPPASPIPAERPDLNDLPPQLIQRIIQKR
jgi:hypothetical protein